MRLYQLLADLMEYPTPALAAQVNECVALLSAVNPQAAAVLGEFRAFVEQTPLPQLQELYTHTFDLQVVCYPYVGYQLFGESYKRGAFLARLNEGYRAHDFTAGNELPDHVAIVLRFLALGLGVSRPGGEPNGETGDFGRTLLREGLLPALEKMAQTFGEDGGNPYRHVVQTLLLVAQVEAASTNLPIPRPKGVPIHQPPKKGG